MVKYSYIWSINWNYFHNDIPFKKWLFKKKGVQQSQLDIFSDKIGKSISGNKLHT